MTQLAKVESKDRTIAVALTLLGGAGLLFALLRHWNAQEMNPGIEGALTVAILAPILAVAGGAGFRATVTMTLPVLAIEYATCIAAGADALPIVSMQLCCLGFLGFLVVMFRPEEASPPPQRRAAGRRAMHGGAQPAHG